MSDRFALMKIGDDAESMNDDFDEVDVFDVVWGEGEGHPSPQKKKSMEHSLGGSSSSSSAWRISSVPRNIPRAPINPTAVEAKVGHQQSSAPVKIPEWPKIHKAVECDDETGDDGEMIPPHEWIARRLKRDQISSSSVCEGIGRTLKGRDLCNVRNAILFKTGFLEHQPRL